MTPEPSGPRTAIPAIPGPPRPGEGAAPRWATLTRRFYPADLVAIGFLSLLIALALSCPARIPMWPAVVATSAAIIAILTGLAAADARYRSRTVHFLHSWAFAPLVYVIYIEIHWVIGPIHRGWVADDALMAIDRTLFGGNPIDWFGTIARPWLTEIAQVAYTLFYALVVAVGAELYLRRSDGDFQRFNLACACVFLGSYVGYFLVPAVGPRFTLYEFSSIERDLPGLLLTTPLRRFVDAGGMVPVGVPQTVALSLAHRDVFPSGHTMMTLVSIWWSWRMRLAVRWPVTVVGALLVFATMYLRYHYVVDVLAGTALAGTAIWLLPTVWEWTVTRLRTRPCDESAPGPAAACAPRR
jgi:membrane-associated phospholipid phosphatase